MSVDERLAHLAASIDAHPVDTDTALAEVERTRTRRRTRTTVIGVAAAAAMVAVGVAVGPAVVESPTGPPDPAPAGQPSAEDIVVVESADDLVGLWATSGIREVYFTFTPDGTFAISRGSPTDSPMDTGIYRVDGSVLTLESTGQGCGGTIGRYLVTFPDPQTLSAELIQDTCSARAADFEKGAPVQKVPQTE